ncbi:MAG: cytochrome c biogenesis protein CcsA [bacterium]
MKYTTFILFAVMIITLAAATVIEKLFGTTFVHSSIYGASWFYIFWGVLSVVALLYMHRSKLQKKLSTYLLHISFILILLGAITTALTSTRGAFYLPVGVERNDFTNSDGSISQFPFDIKLNSFDVEFYAGTNAPADYVSHIFISDNEKVTELLVSMNSIGRYKGYRFYQSDYDKGGSWLTVNRDIYGIPITYTAYILLLLSLIFLLLDPRGAFRALLRSPLLRKSSVAVLLFVSLLLPSTLSAANDNVPHSISVEYAKSLDELQVVYNNRVMPVSTLSRNFTMKILGDTEYKNLSSSQFFWSWLFFPTEWENVPMFEVPQSDKSKFLELNEVAAYADFFTDKGVYKLNHYMRNADPKTQPALYKELVKLNEKVQLVAMLRSGAMVKLFPYSPDNDNITWYAPSDILPEEMDRGQSLFIANSFQMLLSAYNAQDDALFTGMVDKFVSYQNRYGGESLISPYKMRAEQLYYRFPVTTILYRSTLTIGILALLIIMLARNNKRLQRLASRLLVVNIVHAICFLIFHIGIKWYITGKLPLMNGYDTMVFLGFSIAIITFIIRKSYPLFTALSSMLVGFTMLVATIGGLNPQITPLVPVLNSPFLTSHVCCIMLAYALFAFTFINGILALTVGHNNTELRNRLTVYSKLFLFVGIAFIAVGIFIGAVWANVSWGRYWAWDPKEVWALITMMVYCLPLHNRSLKIFNNTTFFHAYLVCAIVVVLMTYFGVNLVLGGMHSYVNS